MEAGDPWPAEEIAMSRKGRTTTQATRAARTLKTIRHMTERDFCHSHALESGPIEAWRDAWGYKSLGGTEYRLQQLQQAGLVWNDGGIWRREEE
jgi:hypothetical protein